MSKNSRLWIFRHAQRDRLARDQFNPGISRDGQLQAKSIAEYLAFMQRELNSVINVMSSPKYRAQETLHPAAENLGMKLEINPDLDERQEKESAADFKVRVGRCLVNLARRAQLKQNLAICSHLDWLEEAAIWLPPPPESFTKEYATHWPTARYLGLSWSFFDPSLEENLSKDRQIRESLHHYEFLEFRNLP